MYSRDTHGRCVRAVRGAERIVHVDLAQRGELLREGGVVLLLLGVVTEVLEEQDLAVVQRRRHLLDLRAHSNRPRSGVGLLTSSASRCATGARLNSGSRFARTAEVAHQNETAAVIQDVPDRRQRLQDAGVVGYRAVVVERDVEVHSHEDALAFTSQSRMESFFMPIAPSASNQPHHVYHAAGVTKLVVVPGHHFKETSSRAIVDFASKTAE
jgi:hypothetical protein